MTMSTVVGMKKKPSSSPSMTTSTSPTDTTDKTATLGGTNISIDDADADADADIHSHPNMNDFGKIEKGPNRKDFSKSESIYFDSNESIPDYEEEQGDDEGIGGGNANANASTNAIDQTTKDLLRLVKSESDTPIVIFHHEEQSALELNNNDNNKNNPGKRKEENKSYNHDDEDHDDANNDWGEAVEQKIFKQIQENNDTHHIVDLPDDRKVQVPPLSPLYACHDKYDYHDTTSNNKDENLQQLQQLPDHDQASSSNFSQSSMTSKSITGIHSSNNSGHNNKTNESQSDSDLESNNSNSQRSHSSQRYKIKNNNTGIVYDIRDLEVTQTFDDEEMLQVKSKLFPSKFDLMEMHSSRLLGASSSSMDDLNNMIGIKMGMVRRTRSEASSRMAMTKARVAKTFSSLPIPKKFSRKSDGDYDDGDDDGGGSRRRRHRNGSDAMNNMSLFDATQNIGALLEPFPSRKSNNEEEYDIDIDDTSDQPLPSTLSSSNSIIGDKKKQQEMVKESVQQGDDEIKTQIDNMQDKEFSGGKENAHDDNNHNEDKKKEDNNIGREIGSEKSAHKQTRTRKTRTKRNNPKANILPLPKNTIPVRCVNKSKDQADFNPLLLITTFAKAHNGAIWHSAFSKDGKYFATAGADHSLKIWRISPENKKKNEANHVTNPHPNKWKGVDFDEEKTGINTVKSEGDVIGLEIDFIAPEPVQSFQEHTQDIVDLSWSETGFLLSASLDTSVRLWHPTKPESLKLFRHAGAVTSVCFHPSEDKYFLSGGFDAKIRIWDITTGRVIEYIQTANVITSASYQPDGKRVAVGLIDGKVIFYLVEGTKLRYYSEILCANGRKKLGDKVTGLTFKNLQNLTGIKDPETPKQKRSKFEKAANRIKSLTHRKKKGEQVLVTSNDSRLRLVGLNDLCTIRKYKGHVNPSLMLKASFSESGKFIIIGSEAGKCTIWNTATRRNPLNINVKGIKRYDKIKAFECFEATTCAEPFVTEALFAPSNSAKNAFLQCPLFPSLQTLDHVNHDFSSSIIVTCDVEGTIRVFLRRASFDSVLHAAGPAGYEG